MSSRLKITTKNAKDYFFLEKLSSEKPLSLFKCFIDEYIDCNEAYCAARFLTVDADIEHDNGVLTFYEKTALFPIPNFSIKTEKLSA